MDNISIKRVKSARYTGVILDEEFKIIKHKIRDSTKPLLLHAYIFSKIQYGIEDYGKASTTTIKKVQITK